jgi:hypothetical protein
MTYILLINCIYASPLFALLVLTRSRAQLMAAVLIILGTYPPAAGRSSHVVPRPPWSLSDLVQDDQQATTFRQSKHLNRLGSSRAYCGGQTALGAMSSE